MIHIYYMQILVKLYKDINLNQFYQYLKILNQILKLRNIQVKKDKIKI